MVVILTPAPTHEGLIRQALEAGKHVYTEKTMTLAPETAAKLIGLAEEKHLYLVPHRTPSLDRHCRPQEKRSTTG